VKFVRNENNIVKKIKEKSRVTLAKAISEYSKSRSPEFSPFPSHSPNKSENRVHDILKTITKKSPTEESPRRRGETGSINSMSSSALNLRSEFGNTSPLKLTTISDEQGLPQRSSSVPKLIRKNSMNTSIGIEGFDNSFQRTVKAVPYPFGNIAAKKAKFRERGRTKSELSHSTERILASTAATNRMQSTEDRFPIHQEEKSKMSMSQTSMTYAENSGQTHNVARTTFNQTRFLSSKRNVSPMMKTVTSQSTKTMYSHRGSFSFGRRKNVDPLAELKESFQAFQTQTENFFEHSERERRLLDAKISKTIKETEKNFKKMEKTSSSIPEINTDEMIHFANQRLFKKELVSKIVASIEDKEDALQAIQKKRFIAEMSKEVLRNLGK